jgi:hypothetical protein
MNQRPSVLGVLLVASVLTPALSTISLRAGVLSAQTATGFTGTWSLSVAKSKYQPGPSPKSAVLRVEQIGNRRKSTLETVTADGGRTRSEYVATLDGKDYPLTGSANADTVSLRQAGPSTIERTDKRKGQVVMLMIMRLSADGKLFTVTQKGITASGDMVNNSIVYERQ